MRVVGSGEGNGVASFEMDKGIFRNNIIDITGWAGLGFNFIEYTNNGANNHPGRATLVKDFHAYNNTLCEFGTVDDPFNGIGALTTRDICIDISMTNNAWYMSTRNNRLDPNEITISSGSVDPTVIVQDNNGYTIDPFVNSVGMTAFGDYVLNDDSLYGADATTRQGKIRPITFVDS